MQSLSRAYFHLALEELAAARPLPALIAFGGPAGTGKTTLSRLLADRWKLAHISSDPIRKRLAGIPVTRRQYEKFGEGIYSKELSRKTYLEMLSQARRHLGGGRSVVLDASFLRDADRRAALELAREFQVGFDFVHCRTDEGELLERLRRRESGRGDAFSDGRVEILLEQRKRWEPHHAVPPAQRLEIETGGGLDGTFEKLLAVLFERA